MKIILKILNYFLFEILPRLKKGVYIHFHDNFYPFEYPYEWIKKEGWIWNELYMLRAFLMNNPFGGSLWIEKL